ncbi:16607_t:CDS:2 [Entrophospora sp. SA101]|nr:16607_t:CDS:2 [Entrophospora sp. SA101]CAJ0846620.1 4916_t:CDS:2 [Entrophospora sp. SA101]
MQGSLLSKFSDRTTKNYYYSDSGKKTSTSLKTKINYRGVKALKEREYTINPDEKFLAYYTHSGYHNQRVGLENALLLAKILNRTLLMPPALLGTPLPWIRFDKMYERLFLATKKGLQHCPKVPRDFPLPAECLNYYSYTRVSWDFLLEMEPIRESQKIIDRFDHSYEWIEENLNLDISKDVRFIRDNKLWDYRIFDTTGSRIDDSNKFTRFLYTDKLKEDPKKLIHFGSLFGSLRVVPEKPSNMQYLKFIRKHLVPNNELVLKATESIVNKLGGVGNFIGLHIRATDGFFMKYARLNIDHIYHNLTNTFTKLTPEEIDVLEGGTHEKDILIDESVDLGEYNPHGNKNKVAQKSLHPSDSGVNTVIFLATDIKSPRSNHLLFKFFNTFPCVFVLGDFEEDLTEILRIMNSDDLTPLADYLIPMLDALISSEGHSFYGTGKSTFSKYIKDTLYPISKGTFSEGDDIVKVPSINNDAYDDDPACISNEDRW